MGSNPTGTILSTSQPHHTGHFHPCRPPPSLLHCCRAHFSTPHTPFFLFALRTTTYYTLADFLTHASPSPGYQVSKVTTPHTPSRHLSHRRLLHQYQHVDARTCMAVSRPFDRAFCIVAVPLNIRDPPGPMKALFFCSSAITYTNGVPCEPRQARFSVV